MLTSIFCLITERVAVMRKEPTRVNVAAFCPRRVRVMVEEFTGQGQDLRVAVGQGQAAARAVGLPVGHGLALAVDQSLGRRDRDLFQGHAQGQSLQAGLVLAALQDPQGHKGRLQAQEVEGQGHHLLQHQEALLGHLCLIRVITLSILNRLVHDLIYKNCCLNN